MKTKMVPFGRTNALRKDNAVSTWSRDVPETADAVVRPHFLVPSSLTT